MPPVLHVCPTVGPQSGATDFSDVPELDGEEAKEVVCLGYKGKDVEGLLGVLDTNESGIFILVPGTNVVVHQQRLYGSGKEPQEGAGKMVTAGGDRGKEGSGKDNFRELLCGSGPSGAPIWVQDVGS